MTRHEILPRSMQRLVQANAAAQMAQAHMQMIMEVIMDAYDLPGPIVEIDAANNVVVCDGPATEVIDAIPAA